MHLHSTSASRGTKYCLLRCYARTVWNKGHDVRLLRRIEVVNSVTITELAEIVGLDRSTLGRNLRVLEKQSLIAIATKDDGRARRVSLTQTGREKLQQAVPLWREAQRKY
jgi:DNA-binding MarR family transcriptional regulator